MIVNYLNIKSIPSVPPEAYAKPVVYTNAVLILSISPKSLESVARKPLEILKASGSADSGELYPSFLMQLQRQQLSSLL
jgi:LPS O-antigen subunit length determinant protein (WzzB/FepE family)